jgi:hypothetical protein
MAASVWAQAQTPPHQVTVVSENQIETIPVSDFSGVPMVPLDALAALIEAELRPGAEQGAMLSARGKVARVSDGRNFVSVEGKLVLLQSPPRRVTGQWFVPLDFIPKVLPTFAKDPLTYRDSERMLVVGDAFPTLEVRSTRDTSYTRIEVLTSRAVPIEVSQTDGEIRLTIQTPYLRTSFQDEEILDEVVERIALRRTERNYELSVKLGKRFWTLQASKRESPDHAVVLDLLRSRIPTSPGQATGSGDDLEDLRSMIGAATRPGQHPRVSTEPRSGGICSHRIRRGRPPRRTSCLAIQGLPAFASSLSTPGTAEPRSAPKGETVSSKRSWCSRSRAG